MSIDDDEVKSELSKLADKYVSDLSKKGALPGIRVNGVLPGSSADKAGIKSGDLIVAVSGQPILSAEDYIASTLGRQGTTQVFDIIRDNSFVQVSIEFPPTPAS